MRFVHIHLVIFGTWTAADLPFVPVPKWNSSLVILAMVASVEAIFLSTFVLITQNRLAAETDKRADLDLHISLLAGHELNQLTSLNSAIAEKLGIPRPNPSELDAAKTDISPEAVLGEIEAREKN